MAVKKTTKTKAVPAKRAAPAAAKAIPKKMKATLQPKKKTPAAMLVPKTGAMAPSAAPSTQKFDAQGEDLALSAPLLVFAALVYDPNLSTMGAAGMNHLVQAKIYIRRIGENIADEKEALEGEKKKIWQLYRLGSAHFALAGYKGSGGAAIRKAILDAWGAMKDKFDSGGVADENLLKLAEEARKLGNPPTAISEQLADGIAKKYGLIA